MPKSKMIYIFSDSIRNSWNSEMNTAIRVRLIIRNNYQSDIAPNISFGVIMCSVSSTHF